MTLSIILPAKNESACLGPLLSRLREQAPDAELILIFMDADGQHDPADIPRLLNQA